MGVPAQTDGGGAGASSAPISTDLTVVSYGGPDVGLLCAAGKVAKVVFGFVTLDSIPTDPHFKAARQNGTVEAMEVDEGMFYLGPAGRGPTGALPPHPGRTGLGRPPGQPELRTVTSPYDDGEELVAMPALRLDAAVVHVNRADARGPGRSSGPTRSSTSCSSAPPTVGS